MAWDGMAWRQQRSRLILTRKGNCGEQRGVGERGRGSVLLPVSAVVGRDDEAAELDTAVTPRAERRQDAAGEAVVAAVPRHLPLERVRVPDDAAAALAPRPARPHPGGPGPRRHCGASLSTPIRRTAAGPGGFNGRRATESCGAACCNYLLLVLYRSGSDSFPTCVVGLGLFSWEAQRSAGDVGVRWPWLGGRAEGWMEGDDSGPGGSWT